MSVASSSASDDEAMTLRALSRTTSVVNQNILTPVTVRMNEPTNDPTAAVQNVVERNPLPTMPTSTTTSRCRERFETVGEVIFNSLRE